MSIVLIVTPCSAAIDESATSTSSPPAAYTSDLVGSYNNDTNRLTSLEDLRSRNSAPLDGEQLRTSSQPLVKTTGRRSLTVTSREKGSLELRDNSDDFGQPYTHKNNYFKPIGIRNTFLTTKQIPTSNTNTPQVGPSFCASSPSQTSNPSIREPEDLVAMGTNWAPAQSQTRIGRSGSLGNGSPIQISHSGSSNLGPLHIGTRRINKVATMPHISTVSRQSFRESEPRYIDPMSGSHPSFQARIAELANLESETIRWERARKVKKKPKEKE